MKRTMRMVIEVEVEDLEDDVRKKLADEMQEDDPGELPRLQDERPACLAELVTDFVSSEHVQSDLFAGTDMYARFTPESARVVSADYVDNGRAKLEDVRAGDKLMADSGFTCVDHGAVLKVERDDEGLFVTCRDGKHHLDGQLDEDGYLVGLAWVPEDPE